MLLVDGSESVSEANFVLVKSFLREFSETFQGTFNGSIAIAEYSSGYTQVSPAFSSNQTLTLEQIQGMSQTFGVTNTGTALSQAQDFLLQTNDGRGQDTVLVVLTDGATSPTDLAALEESRIRLSTQSNVAVFAIGIGFGPDTAELQKISGEFAEPFTRTFPQLSFSELQSFASNLIGSITEESCTFEIQRTCTEQSPRDIIIAVDVSQSLNAPNFDRVKTLLQTFVGLTQAGGRDDRILVLAYAGEDQIITDGFVDPATAADAINFDLVRVNSEQSTNGFALQRAFTLIATRDDRSRQPFTILLTDSATTDSLAAISLGAAQHNAQQWGVVAVSLGNRVPDEQLAAMVVGDISRTIALLTTSFLLWRSPLSPWSCNQHVPRALARESQPLELMCRLPMALVGWFRPGLH